MELVEQLDSGVPRILQFYGKECFKFSGNFIRMSFPMLQVTKQVDMNNKGVNDDVNKLVEIIGSQPGLNAKQLHTHFEVTQRTLERWIKQLREKNKIEFRGAPKTGGYLFQKIRNIKTQQVGLNLGNR